MTKRFKPGAAARYVTEAALAVSLAALTGAAFAAVPGYVTSGGGDYAVTDSSGNCWRSGGWTANDAREPCDAVPHAAAPAPATGEYQPRQFLSQAKNRRHRGVKTGTQTSTHRARTSEDVHLNPEL